MKKTKGSQHFLELHNWAFTGATTNNDSTFAKSVKIVRLFFPNSTVPVCPCAHVCVDATCLSMHVKILQGIQYFCKNLNGLSGAGTV